MLRSVYAEANFGACFGVCSSGGPSRPRAVSAAGTISEVAMSARPDVSCGAAETLAAAPSSAGPVATIAAGFAYCFRGRGCRRKGVRRQLYEQRIASDRDDRYPGKRHHAGSDLVDLDSGSLPW